MATVKPAFGTPEDPRDLQAVLNALKQEARFADLYEMIGRIGRVAVQEHRTGMERALSDMLPLAVTARLEGQPKLVRNRRALFNVIAKEWQDDHMAKLMADKQQLDHDLVDSPPLIYVGFKNKVIQPVTGVEIVVPRPDSMGNHAPAYLLAYSGDLAVGSGSVMVQCDVAAIPDGAAQEVIRQYDL